MKRKSDLAKHLSLKNPSGDDDSGFDYIKR